MGSGISAVSVSSLRELEQSELIDRCAILYASDPLYFEYIVTEAKNKSIELYANVVSADNIANSVNSEPKSMVSQPLSIVKSSKNLAVELKMDSPDSQHAGGSGIVRGNSLELIAIINRVRMNPPDFVSALQAHLSKFIDETVYQIKIDGKTINIRTNEGKAAVLSAIEFLQGQPPMDPLKFSPLLESAAIDHATDIHTNKVSGHEVLVVTSYIFLFFYIECGIGKRWLNYGYES